MDRTGLNALRALAVIRLFNGVLALFAPQVLLKRVGGDPVTGRVAYYPLRMFGIRTVLLGAELLTGRGPELRRATRAAVLIHAADTAAAAVGGVRRDVSPKVAVMTTAISAINTTLAVIALRRRPWLGPRRSL